MASLQLKRLGYPDVTFCVDSANLFNKINASSHTLTEEHCTLSTYIKDIYKITSSVILSLGKFLEM
ncbi:unnamed protein product [Thlaspi arvense]|uniref:Uncharacterized protein n=1 Tax=Thlaspi arvense TaxID=13288 RepID=A0AAU9RPY3_THLAR|nr:unnamed protein product [Thlaspi arvense]